MKARVKLTLDQSAFYQVKVQGHLDERWTDWAGEMTVAVREEDEGLTTTMLSGVIADQAALQGLLRRLYSLGLPLISVIWIE